LKKYRNGTARTRLFFRKYGLASIFLGRFLGPIRSTVPLLAGMMVMSHFRFQIANVLSAIAWSICMLIPGWIAGQSAAEFEDGTYLERGMIIAAVSLAIVFVSGVVAKRIFRPSHDEVRSRRARVHGCCGGAHASCSHHH
jgi:membrane protein DedA with SNARE-associated domain